MGRVLAAALLCTTLLFCGLDSSAVGHPADGETALHALDHGQGGARVDVALAAQAAFVALGGFALRVSPRGAHVLRHRRTGPSAKLADGWRARRVTRGPPALA